AATEACRVAPPTASRTRTPAAPPCVIAEANAARWSRGTVTTISSTAPDVARFRAACTTNGTPPAVTRALGSVCPRRVPLPAAVRTAATRTGSGRQDLVEDRLGLLLLGVLGECELRDEDLARLREHALLARGQAAVRVTPREVADDLGD